jgi:hypothetical protein
MSRAHKNHKSNQNAAVAIVEPQTEVEPTVLESNNLEQTLEPNSVIEVTTPVPTEAPKTSLPTLKEMNELKLMTKSSQIKYLDSLGHKRAEISKHLTAQYGKLVRYQHVRNVLTQIASSKSKAS